MVMYANEFKTKGKQKLTEIKNELQHIYIYMLCKKNGTVRKLFFTLIYICKRTAFFLLD